MIKILITDDSATDTALLKHLFNTQPDMEVIGVAKNGKEAVELATHLQPDLITMDIQMPLMNGYEATKLIMMKNPVPIVVISSTLNDKDVNASFLALDAGAVSVLEKPVNKDPETFHLMCKRLIHTVRSMAEIKVVRRRFIHNTNETASSKDKPQVVLPHKSYEIVAIGTSVGGPQVLKDILSKLPSDFPVPIVIVQHMTVGFMEGFCAWLNEYSTLTIKCVEDYEVLKAGTVYFAPELMHFKITRVNANLVGLLYEGPPVAGFCPSITVLLDSVAEICGSKAIGILLTGMGQDGAEGLLKIKQKKGHTLIQNKETSVVYGMAAFAESLGAVDKIITPEQLVPYLIQLMATAIKEE